MNFDFGSGPVPAHRHKNPDGSVGGWVADTAYVDDVVFVGEYAQVYGNAQVYGTAKVYGFAKVYGSDKVFVNKQCNVSGNDNMKNSNQTKFKFLLFAGKNYYLEGGCKDYKGEFNSLDEAKDFLIKHHYEWSHVVDKDTKEVVWKSEQ